MSAIDNSITEAFANRADRAEELAKTSAAAAEPLRFAAALFRAQGACAEALHRLPLTGRLADDSGALAPALLELARRISWTAPPALAAQAGSFDDLELLLAHWRGEQTAAPYLARALLRPYVESLARRALKPDRAPGSCGFCGNPPFLAVRRPQPESDGAARFLCCGLCGSETPFARIRCPSCGEDDPARLPTYSADAWPAARIESCESCKHYVKSIDLSLDARPIPEVDELLSIGLDLWAADQGLARIEPGLAGV